MGRAIKLALVAVVGMFLILVFASILTDFGTWPWQVTQAYVNGDLGLTIGEPKRVVWARVLELQKEGKLVPGAGLNNDSRASTTEFSQVHDLDWWSFPIPPCCRCSVDLTFDSRTLKSFERHCNYAPEGT